MGNKIRNRIINKFISSEVSEYAQVVIRTDDRYAIVYVEEEPVFHTVDNFEEYGWMINELRSRDPNCPGTYILDLELNMVYEPQPFESLPGKVVSKDILEYFKHDPMF